MNINKFSFIFSILIMDLALACSTCYGDPDSNAAKGMDMAIFTLLGIIGPLLIAILMGIISLGMKSKRLNKSK